MTTINIFHQDSDKLMNRFGTDLDFSGSYTSAILDL